MPDLPPNDQGYCYCTALAHVTETGILNPVVRAGEAVWLQIGPSTSNQSVAIRWINDAGQQFGNIITLAGNTRVSLVPPAELRGWALLVVEEERERRVFRVRVL